MDYVKLKMFTSKEHKWYKKMYGLLEFWVLLVLWIFQCEMGAIVSPPPLRGLKELSVSYIELCECYSRLLAKVSYPFSLTPVMAYFSVKKKSSYFFILKNNRWKNIFFLLKETNRRKNKLVLKNTSRSNSCLCDLCRCINI